MRLLPPLCTAALLLASVLVRPAYAAGEERKRFELTPMAGYTRFDNELTCDAGAKIEDGIYLGGRLSTRLHSLLWLDLAGGVTEAKSHGADLTWTHLSGNLMLTSPESRGVHPFVSLGAGASTYKPRLTNDKHDLLFEQAAGLRIGLNDVLGVRLEARNLLTIPREHWSKSHLDNMVFAVGLSLGFGSKPHDSDGDGVFDHDDQCPNTMAGCKVDAQGCPIDSDGDGVCDGLDQCANTPKGAHVDAKGCPTDADHDGVWDGLDQCADTPAGCKVDAKGCPIDSDHDGVCDGVDQCPNTPTGCTVDAKGCTVDSDGDGVCDGLDKCANTPAGTRVDEDGCPLTEVRQREMELLDTGMIRLQDIHFVTAKSDIMPDSRTRLDTVGQVLSKWPQLKIEVGGYCDSRGNDRYNLALSNRRTAAVRMYLLKHYPRLQAAQMTAKGYGKANPIMPNTTPANMAQNRRVEFVVLNKEILKQLKP